MSERSGRAVGGRRRLPAATRLRTVLVLALALAAGSAVAQAPDRAGPETPLDRRWALTVFHGWFTEDSTFGDTLFLNADLGSEFRFAGVALSRPWRGFWGNRLTLEYEGQLVRHYRSQHHWELNGLGIARWNAFPWDRYLDTSLAFGAGLSYASEQPAFELRHADDTGNLLAYLLVEAEVGLPQLPAWSLVARIHHRSTAFETIHSSRARSNAVALGVRYKF